MQKETCRLTLALHAVLEREREDGGEINCKEKEREREREQTK